MSDLRFLRLHLVSHKESRGRTIEFHPKTTVILGTNDVGKSSIAKSLYAALGANAAEEHPRWLASNAVSLLEFTVDGIWFAMLKEGKVYALFDSQRRIGTYTSVTGELGPAVAELVGASLKLTDRSGKVVTPPPAFLFLPFYCDQDKGWTDTWCSFAKLGQFAQWKPDVINYHAGILSDAYYRAQERLANAKLERQQPARELDGMMALRRRADQMLGSDIDIELDPSVFSEEISKLLSRSAEVAARRERARQNLAQLTEQRIQLAAQKDILERVRKELHADYTYAVNLPEDRVECPTCGQMHENSFGERFSIAQDEARTGDLLTEVLNLVTDNATKLSAAKADIESTTEQEKAIQELLTRKRGQITFAELLDRAGNKKFARELESQVEELLGKIAVIDSEIGEAEEEVAQSKSKSRRDEILSLYLQLMTAHLSELKVNSLAEKSYSSITCALKETGSDRPRAILAYFFAMLELIWKADDGLKCPIVLDSPNQQDQSQENHMRMLAFIRDHQPIGSQLILFAVDVGDTEFDGDQQVLTDVDFLLSEEHYEQVAANLYPYQAMRDQRL